jgi:hypothetical protein
VRQPVGFIGNIEKLLEKVAQTNSDRQNEHSNKDKSDRT